MSFLEHPEILFITRNYPPIVGGLEKYSFRLIEAFAKRMPTHKIVLSKSRKHLFWFLPYSLFKALYSIGTHPISHVHLCDGLLAPLGLIIKNLTKKNVSATIHGLDITFDRAIYQRVVPKCVSRLDKIICVSHATRREVFKRTHGLLGQCAVIPNGIVSDEMYLVGDKMAFQKRLGHLTHLNLWKRKILFTIGHLVRRKGVAWFVEAVMPKLPEEYVYLVAGDGPERGPIEKATVQHGLENRVFLLGEISDDIRNILYNLSDIFVMPNIRVPGDMEGFGIVAIEAGTAGLPVVASNLQGIKDAVIDGKTGILVEEGDVEGYATAIQGVRLERDEIRRTVNEAFGWNHVFEEYRRVLFP